MLYRFRLSKYERYPLDCYHSNQNVNRNPSLNSASLLFRLLGELDVLVRFWWGSSPALSPPPPRSSPTFPWQRFTPNVSPRRGERGRGGCFAFFGHRWEQFHRMSCSPEHGQTQLWRQPSRNTHTHSAHPLLHIPPNPYTASLGIISQMFQSSGMLHLRVTGIPVIKNICFRGNHAEDFSRKSSNVRTCRNTNGGERVWPFTDLTCIRSFS